MLTLPSAFTILNSKLGNLLIVSNGKTITGLNWTKKRQLPATSALLKTASEEIVAYLAGKLKSFSVPTETGGTQMQKAIWEMMSDIPYGKTLTYGEVAAKLKTSPRVIGNACGANPIPIIIPCHRIVGKQGLGGYSGNGGLRTKQFLLDVENGVAVK